jgi:hypothetical protein
MCTGILHPFCDLSNNENDRGEKFQIQIRFENIQSDNRVDLTSSSTTFRICLHTTIIAAKPAREHTCNSFCSRPSFFLLAPSVPSQHVWRTRKTNRSMPALENAKHMPRIIKTAIMISAARTMIITESSRKILAKSVASALIRKARPLVARSRSVNV